MPSDVPASITVTESPDSLTLVRPWRGTRHLFGMNQAVFMFGFVVIVGALGSIGLVSADVAGRGWPLFIAFAILLYVCALNVVNRTTISVRDGALAVEHGPLPWLRSRRVPTDQVTAVGVSIRSLRATVRGRDISLFAYPAWVELPASDAISIAEVLRRRLGVPDLAAA